MLKITALMDDKPSSDPRLQNEHGLSLFVEYGGKRILFDCGPGPAFLHNAQALGMDLKQLDAVVLSHSHYDHAGGYPALVEQSLGSRLLYTGPGFFREKYSRKDGSFQDRSAGFTEAFLTGHGICHQTVEGFSEVFPGVYLIGNFPRVQRFETVPERYVRRAGQGFQRDDFGDEICMALETEEGLVLLAGCSHPGILNMVSHVRSLLNRPVRAVFGGTHLMGAEADRIEKTLDGLLAAGVEMLGLSHCSGEEVEEALGCRPSVRSCHLAAGESFCFPS